MAEHYGKQGNTDPDGFNPYADSVGAGIYGGNVKRDAEGKIIIGRQYQNHNRRPGPVYAGTGYSEMSKALKRGPAAIDKVLDLQGPEAINEITTGGATPLHMCGMGRDNQRATAYVIEKGGDINAVDTYGYTPLHRMASNNLAIGGEALLKAGADPRAANGHGETPLSIGRASAARDFLKVLKRYLDKPAGKPAAASAKRLRVSESGVSELNGEYEPRGIDTIPVGFAKVCEEQGWGVQSTWDKLAHKQAPWWLATNGSYIYLNNSDGKWWMDGPDGHGLYIAGAQRGVFEPPTSGWKPLGRAPKKVPTLKLLRAEGERRSRRQYYRVTIPR